MFVETELCIPVGLPVLVGLHIGTQLVSYGTRAGWELEAQEGIPLCRTRHAASSSPVKRRTSPNAKCEGISWGKWTELCTQVWCQMSLQSLCFLKEQSEKHKHTRSGERWGNIELFWLMVQGSLRERPRVVLSPTFRESLGTFYPGTVQYFRTRFHPEWGKRGLKRRHSNLTVGTSRWKTRRALRYVTCLSCARHSAWYVLHNSPTLPACYRE